MRTVSSQWCCKAPAKLWKPSSLDHSQWQVLASPWVRPDDTCCPSRTCFSEFSGSHLALYTGGNSTFRCSCSVHEHPRTLVYVSPQTSPNPPAKVRKAPVSPTWKGASFRRPYQAWSYLRHSWVAPGGGLTQPHYSQRNGPAVKLIGKIMWEPPNQSWQHHLSSSSLYSLLIPSWFWCLCHSFPLYKRRLLKKCSYNWRQWLTELNTCINQRTANGKPTCFVLF